MYQSSQSNSQEGLNRVEGVSSVKKKKMKRLRQWGLIARNNQKKKLLRKTLAAMKFSSSEDMKEVKTKEYEIVWGFYLDSKFHEAYREIMEWITLDPTLKMAKHDPRLAQGWKSLKPFRRLQNGGDLCPLEKKVEETLIPL